VVGVPVIMSAGTITVSVTITVSIATATAIAIATVKDSNPTYLLAVLKQRQTGYVKLLDIRAWHVKLLAIST
jgi:hypothetical protein